MTTTLQMILAIGIISFIAIGEITRVGFYLLVACALLIFLAISFNYYLGYILAVGLAIVLTFRALTIE